MRFNDAGSNGKGEVTVPLQQGQFLYKAKGKVCAGSPSPVFDFQTTGASTSSSHVPNDLPAPMAPKCAMTLEENDDDDTSKLPTKRRESKPLVREGTFYQYPTPAQPENDSDADSQPVHMNLIGSFLPSSGSRHCRLASARWRR
jgi:hypothetical protein